MLIIYFLAGIGSLVVLKEFLPFVATATLLLAQLLDLSLRVAVAYLRRRMFAGVNLLQRWVSILQLLLLRWSYPPAQMRLGY